MENTQRDKLVVVNDNVLAVVYPERPNTAQVLRASVLRGSFDRDGDIMFIKGKNVRLASEKDFDDFRVCFSPIGFGNPDNYEFQQ